MFMYHLRVYRFACKGGSLSNSFNCRSGCRSLSAYCHWRHFFISLLERNNKPRAVTADIFEVISEGTYVDSKIAAIAFPQLG